MKPRTGQAPSPLSRDAFGERFRQAFLDPAFRAEQGAIDRLEEIAWQAHQGNRKSPGSTPAGPGYADPSHPLAPEWRETHDRLAVAGDRQRDAATASRALVICGSPRNDATCPGEMSKTWRLARIAEETLRSAGVETDLLDLSLVNSEYGRRIHPCKGCVATAMPLCHWPCSCYPNHALGQVGDWMNEIYVRWTEAHAVLIATPVHWYQAPSVLKLMIDRLVCADGGNPDITTTHGKKTEEAKNLELIVHGDVAGTEGVRRALSDWLDWMGLVDAGPAARLDRFIGYYQPYATSHDALDADTAVQEEARNVARAVATAVADLRAGRLSMPDAKLSRPRPK
jgi:multimeric flavodoxin WrbA